MSEDIVHLAETLDTEDMIGFTKMFVDDLERGQNAVNEELLPWLSKLRHKWTGVLFLGMGGSAAGGDFISALSDRSLDRLDQILPFSGHIQRFLTVLWTA